MSTISPVARQELVTAVAERYQQSTAAGKRRILDEFVALTGYHRKHAILVLNGHSATPTVPRGRRCIYDEAVTEGLLVLWEASDRMCEKRLQALLPILVRALERHGDLRLDPGVCARLLAVSAVTIDRPLAPARAVTAGQRRRPTNISWRPGATSGFTKGTLLASKPTWAREIQPALAGEQSVDTAVVLNARRPSSLHAPRPNHARHLLRHRILP